MSYVNPLLRVMSVKENFNNHENMIIYSVYNSQPLLSVTSVTAQCAHEQDGHGGRDGRYAWAQ